MFVETDISLFGVTVFLLLFYTFLENKFKDRLPLPEWVILNKYFEVWGYYLFPFLPPQSSDHLRTDTKSQWRWRTPLFPKSIIPLLRHHFTYFFFSLRCSIGHHVFSKWASLSLSVHPLAHEWWRNPQCRNFLDLWIWHVDLLDPGCTDAQSQHQEWRTESWNSTSYSLSIHHSLCGPLYPLNVKRRCFDSESKTQTRRWENRHFQLVRILVRLSQNLRQKTTVMDIKTKTLRPLFYAKEEMGN